tara:strand:+ start:159 stop:470 length:312 start_codon:yes stop_codon:yes gene_type:complete
MHNSSRDRRNYRGNRRYNNHRNPRVTKKLNIKSKNPSHVTTYAKEGEHPERTIKRFLKKCKKEKVIENARKYDYYEKPSVKRRRAKLRREALIKKANRENKEA